MLIRNFGMLAVSTALFCNIGCDKPGAAEQQKETNAVQQYNQAQQGAAQQSASAQADMQDKIASAQADYQKARDDYSRDRQQDLKEIDDRISKLEERAQSTTAGTRTRLDQTLATLRAERAAFASDVRSIGNVAATDWDQFKSKVDVEYDNLKTHLDKAS
jgi:membrane-anchored protein YejM (alkaline phosphatase superfamily)